MKTYKEFLFESKTKEIICYHISDDLEHMENCDFKLEKANDLALLGTAIYFSSTSQIEFRPMYATGRCYCCKFSIILDEPVLDMNKEITTQESNKLLKDFNTMFKINDPKLNDYNFDNDFDGSVQYGEFFGMISELKDWDYNKYYRQFIQKHLGYNSFQYFQNSYTDFRTEEGDYGRSYGLYDKKNIKFLDGPY